MIKRGAPSAVGEHGVMPLGAAPDDDEGAPDRGCDAHPMANTVQEIQDTTTRERNILSLTTSNRTGRWPVQQIEPLTGCAPRLDVVSSRWRHGTAMRMQYHGQQTDRGFLVWDVRRLIRLAEDLPTVRVSLDEIWELDRVRWFDSEEPPTCRQLLEHMRLVLDADTSYPILLGRDGRVMDGMHRVLKVALAGENGIQAKRFDAEPQPDYVDVSLSDLPYDDESV